jgi:lysophospholipase L1-like esterase
MTWIRCALASLSAVLAVSLCSALTGCTSASSGSAAGNRSVAGSHPSISLAALRAGLTRGAGAGPAYYLALGDSLAQGIQPGPAGRNHQTAEGYPDQLADQLKLAIPGLALVKLGCSGETTSTMIHGGICHYQAGSQLAQATRFLRRHRGRVALVTIDIGANDPNSCLLRAQLSTIFGCLSGRVTRTERNLSRILARLRSAAGPSVLIVGMTYYVPELGLWLNGRTGKEVAVIAADLIAGVNRLLSKGYYRYGARVANVFGAFRSADFAGAARHLQPTGAPGQASAPGQAGGPGQTSQAAATARVPPNVAEICALTWMCASPPRGPNEHANDAGYHLIAQSFWQTITR